MGMEEVLLEYLLKGSRLLEKRCPACHNQLLKKGVTPVLLSPASVHGNSSFESCPSIVEEENDKPWEPIEGLPFCLACEAHVVTNEFELSYASETLSNKSKVQKKGALLHLMDGSRPGSPAKSPIRSGRIKPTLSISTESVFFSEEILLSPAEKDDKDCQVKENVEPSSHHKFPNMQKVKELLIPSMQSRAVVSTIENQEAFSPLSHCIEVDLVCVNNEDKSNESDLADDPEPEMHQAANNSLTVVVEEPASIVQDFSKVDPKNNPTPSSSQSHLANQSAEPTKDMSSDIHEAANPSLTVAVEIPVEQEVSNVDAKNECVVANESPVISPRNIEYNTRRNIATKCIAKKMMEGYSIIETPCTDCGMPLMEMNGIVACVVCPELTENLEKLQQLNLTEQLRMKKSVDKQRLSEELMKKKEQERQARELAQKKEEDARLKAIAEKKAREEVKAKEESDKMEKLLATLQDLEAKVEGKIEVEPTENEQTVVVPPTSEAAVKAKEESDKMEKLLATLQELEAKVEGRIEAEPTENEQTVVVPTTSEAAAVCLPLEVQNVAVSIGENSCKEVGNEILAKQTLQQDDINGSRNNSQEVVTEKTTAVIPQEKEPARDGSDTRHHKEGAGFDLFNEPDVMRKEKKRLEVIDVEAPWLQEIQKPQKSEQAVPVSVKVDSHHCATEFRLVRDVASLEERQKRDEERRLRQEKVLKDKVAIEKAKKERIEAAKRRVEETARAEAVLMAKLQEESEAAKSAIDYAKRLSTPIGEGKQTLSYFFCSSTPEKTGTGENLEDEWENRRKKALASIPSRLNQGWKKTELYCQGTKCSSVPLLTFRSSSPYCIVCGGCGSGTDGLYKKSTSPVSPSRSGKRKPSTPIIPKMFEFVKVQPGVTTEPTVLPLVKKLLSEGEIDEEVTYKRSLEEKFVSTKEETSTLNEHTKPMESVEFEKSQIMGTKAPVMRDVTANESVVEGGQGQCTNDESRHVLESKQLKNLETSEVKPVELSSSKSAVPPPADAVLSFTNSQDTLIVSLRREKELQESNKGGLTVEITNRTVKDEECRQDANTTQFQDTRESVDPPLVGLPPPHERRHERSHSRVEILELFDLNASLTGKKEIPRTPAIARPNMFGDFGEPGERNKSRIRSASKSSTAKVVRSSTDQSKVPSFDNDLSLAAIMNDLSQIKLKLNSSGLETDPLSGKNDFDNLLEKLSSAALAMKNTN